MTRAALLLLALAACAPSLRPPPRDGGPPEEEDGGADAGPSRVIATVEPDGGVRVVVDATSSEVWVYVDLESGAEVTEATPSWDLGVQRFKVKTNGGVSGDGGVEGTALAQDYDAVLRAPDSGWLIDLPDSDDEGVSEDFVFLTDGGWYEYESKYHTLKPKNLTYVVHTVERGYYKVRMLGFYDRAGTSGYTSFKFAPVSPP
jgi:HmuY protein